MMALGVGGDRGKALQAIVQSLHHSSELEAWGLMVEASEEFQKSARRLRLSAHPENTWFSIEERELFSRIAQALQQKSSSLQDLSSVQEPSSNSTIDIKKIEAALEGLLEGTTSAATMETTLGDLLPSLSVASAHRLTSSEREDSYQHHTSSLTDTDEEFSSAAAGKAGSLVRRKETLPGYSYLTISIDKIGLKDPQDYIDPSITVSVKNLLGKDLEAVQITPVASERETSYIVFGNEVEVHNPLEEMPSGAAIFFEFKHYKPKKGITSTRCFSFMEMDEVKPGKSFLEMTFAYVTVKDRMPRILTQVIDTVNKEEAKMNALYGTAGTEDIKSVLSQLSELRYQLETNKAILPIKHGEDAKEWAMAHETYCRHLGSDPLWYRVSWLFAECYMYRRIAEIFQTSTYMKDFDPFNAQKESTFVSSLPQITAVAKYLNGALSKPNVQDQDIKDLRTEFEHLLLLCLWGNKIDLSMMASVDEYDITHEAVPLHRSDSHEAQRLRTNVLADHSTALWELMKLIKQPKSDQSVKRRIDFVLDNAGYEIFADVAFADWLLSVKLADQIHFHCKKLPWFVSDALIKDLNWTVEQLCSSEDKILSNLGKKWKSRIEDGSFVISDHSFWTTSYEYAAMKTVAPELYSLLSESFLIIFKGDLNYRKLLADRNWMYTQDFSIALGGFQPTNVCALRTLKADLVTGLPPGVAEKTAKENKDWMITGQYAVLQVHNTSK